MPHRRLGLQAVVFQNGRLIPYESIQHTVRQLADFFPSVRQLEFRVHLVDLEAAGHRLQQRAGVSVLHKQQEAAGARALCSVRAGG